MKFKSPIFSQASGSLAGTVFSHNRGGMYVRARSIPTNPNTPFQQALRGFMTQLATAWSSTLTPGQRAAWELYAANVPLIDRLGEPRTVTGLNMYTRSNVPRLQAGLARLDNAPTIFDLGSFTEPTIDAIDVNANTADIGFTAGDDWVSEDGAALLVYISRPQSQSINYFKGPYRFAGAVLGNSTTPPTSPQTINLPFPAVAGQRLFFAFNVTRADGRLSTRVLKFRDT